MRALDVSPSAGCTAPFPVPPPSLMMEQVHYVMDAGEMNFLTGDRCIRATVHHCFFNGTRQRYPDLGKGNLCCLFQCRVAGDDYVRGFSVYSQCNIYDAGQKKMAFKYYTEKASDRAEESSGCIRSEGDLFVDGTQQGLMPLPSETCIFYPSEHYDAWTVEAPTDNLKHFLQYCIGWQRIARPADIPTS